MLCARCGTKNPQNSAYCYDCGQNLSSPPDVSGLNDIDVKKLAEELRERTAWVQNNKEAALKEPYHLFFFSAVDRDGVTRFFDIMPGKDGCTLAETATTAPILDKCVETFYKHSGNGWGYGHRNYGSYSATDPHRAMQNFADLHRLTQVAEISETLNALEARPIWNAIWRKLGCPPAINK